jgi:hypothetical protein
MTADELAAIKARANSLTYALDHDHIGAVASFGHTVASEDIPRLVAEVQRLRAQVELFEEFPASQLVARLRAIADDETSR